MKDQVEMKAQNSAVPSGKVVRTPSSDAALSEAKRHPLAIAWDKWLGSFDGIKAVDPTTLGRHENSSTYLANRLHCAFEAGAEAQRDALREAFKELLR